MYRSSLLVLASLVTVPTSIATADDRPGPMTAPARLFQSPRHEEAPSFQAEGVRAVFYEGMPYHGKPTRVFAWVGTPRLKQGEKAPGIVLVHGGGGTAFDAWVRLWTSRGHAAIAMDTCGSVPRGTYGKWERHDQGGPPGWGGFDQVDEPQDDQWPYHAVSDVILAHSLLRSLPEVDPDRIGLTGISWGGYLTCIVSGLDDRFRFAVPVYGCGFLGDNSAWAGSLAKMGDRGTKWLAMWDPSHYLPAGKMPKLWVTGTNDFAYPMDSLQKSYRAAGGSQTLCVRPRMPHGHGGAGENPAEIHAFADSIVNHGPPLSVVKREDMKDGRCVVTYQGDTARTAELHFTRSSGKWTDRLWESAPADLDLTARRASALVPPDATAWFFNLIDEAGRAVSTPHRTR
jgi:dienelactone hydrolase